MSVLLQEAQFWSANPGSAAIISPEEISDIKFQFEEMVKVRNEQQLCIPVAIVLNTLSMAQARHNANVQQSDSLEHTPTIVHLVNLYQSPLGDVHDTKHQPNIVMTFRPYSYAEEYLESLKAGEPLDTDTAWLHFSALVAAGEMTLSTDGTLQLLNYLDTIKRYRPDTDRAYGLFGQKAGFSVFQLNPCQTSKLVLESEDKQGLYSWKNPSTISTLQRFVIATYATPILHEILVLRNSTNQVWTFNHGNTKWNLAPFYAAHGPGRMTWVAAAFKTGVEKIQGVAKLYWPDKGSQYEEVDLYAKAHGQIHDNDTRVNGLVLEGEIKMVDKKSWLGGLARVEQSWRMAKALDGFPPSPDERSISRQLVGLLLGSSGKPLNNLKTDVDILKCMYDLLQTLQRMNENGVLHRDISYGNVFCDPTHFIDPEDEGDIIGCIDQVLGEPNQRSRVLVTDLDQGSHIDVSNLLAFDPHFVGGSPDANKAPVGRHQRIVGLSLIRRLAQFSPLTKGRPMFAAAAIAEPGWEYPNPISALRTLSYLLKEMAAQEGLKKFASSDLEFYEGLLSAALAGGNEYEDTRRAQEFVTEDTGPPLHRPVHDAESVYWLMSFLLARAMPADAIVDTTPQGPNGLYDCFCTGMLYHYIGEPVQARSKWGDSIKLRTWLRTLHPKLQHHAHLLTAMAFFLSIDWVAICPGTHENFAYRVLKLFILAAILKTEKETKLHTHWPRPATNERDAGKPTARKTTASTDTRTSFCNVTSSSSKGIQLNHTLANTIDPEFPKELAHKTRKNSCPITVGGNLEIAQQTDEKMFMKQGEGAREMQIQRLTSERWYTFVYTEE